MNNTAPKELGIVAVAALFSLIAFVVSLVVMEFSVFAAILLGLLVGVVSAVVLWLGWRDPVAGPTGPRDLSPKTRDAATVKAPAASAAATSTPAPAVKSAPDPAAPPAAKEEVATAPSKESEPVAEDGQPEILSKPRSGGADDLKELKGVGPALEKTLNELGFYHFDQVASWRKEEIEWVDSRLRFKGRIERDGWVAQAKTLAKGSNP